MFGFGAFILKLRVSGAGASGREFAQSQCTKAADIKSLEIAQLGQRRGSCRELDHATRACPRVLGLQGSGFQ